MIRLGYAVAAAIVLADQLSKWWILAAVMDPPREIALLPFFNLILAWNRGVSFGFLGELGWIGPWLLSGLAIAIVIALTVWLSRLSDRYNAISIGLIIGGALGNVIDRLRFGAVVDFLDVHAAGYHWPAFNLADSAITVGVAFLLIESLFVRGERAG